MLTYRLTGTTEASVSNRADSTILAPHGTWCSPDNGRTRRNIFARHGEPQGGSKPRSTERLCPSLADRPTARSGCCLRPHWVIGTWSIKGSCSPGLSAHGDGLRLCRSAR